MRKILLILVAAVLTPTLAQESASFKLREHVVNAGGRPEGGTVAVSASFALTLDAIGESVVAAGLAGANYRLDASFVGALVPAGEVEDLRFTSREGLVWNAERSAGRYNLYRDPIASLPGSFGSCLTAGIAGTTFTDVALPKSGQGFFYLVTVENRLYEEGTKGDQGDGTPRGNPAPCP